MGSPQRLNSYKERTDQFNSHSTNKFAPYSNGFHRSTNQGSQPNYKNYSEVPIGKNDQIKQCYEKQFYDRRRACDMKFGAPNTSDNLVYFASPKTQMK